jgi:carboxyl-terminal processing protease
MGERDDEFAMPWTRIAEVDHEQNVFRVRDLGSLRQRSEDRVSNDPTFQKILENARRLEQQREDSEYPLNLEAFMALSDEQEAKAAQYRDLMDDVVNRGVTNLEVDLPSIHADESRKARNDNFIEMVSKDIHIKETLNIMHDLITLE